MMSMSPIAPIRKDSPVGAGERLRTVRDFQELSSENLTNDQLTLFPVNPDRDAIARNYESNPLPRNIPYRILSVGFTLNRPTLETASGVDPVGIKNALRSAVLHVDRAEGDTTVLKLPFQQLWAWHKIKTLFASYDNGTNSDEIVVVNMGSSFIHRLPDPNKVALRPNERFEFKVYFEGETVGFIPSNSDLTISLGCFLQIAHPPIQ